MKINATHEVPTNASTTFKLLIDPDVLVRTVPGLKTLQLIGDNEYAAELELGIKAVKGHYKGTVKLVDVVDGEEFRLLMDGQGKLGFVQQDILIKLEQVSNDQTIVNCDGVATIGGVLAGVGNRMLGGVAKLLMGQFFKALSKEASNYNNVNAGT
ncbi:CoxG family protein [Bacillus alveayuensis]|uniref:CoxG family protein n=1 Tax=Aeribacillus alveayuensis TaxID=279215 RepID=UPI0005D114F1|nr:carbon monoxide dehydrogenase subunit G [Bacillus alveayuensis]